MPPNHPDISVVIPLYNKEKSIERAIRSVLEQNKLPLEIIVIDDGSDDKSSEIAIDLQSKYSIIKYVRQSNQGVSVARNHGVAEAAADYICFLDADDEWDPKFMRNLLNLMNIAEEADIFSLAYKMNSDKGIERAKVALPKGYTGYVKDPINTYRKGYGLICSSVVCMKKSFFLKMGGFPPGLIYGEDIYLWIKSFLFGKVAFSNLISATIHKEQINSKNRRKLQPYHILYFTHNLNEFEPTQRKAIKKFLVGNIYIQWAAAKLEDNKWQQKTLQQYCFRLSKIKGLLLAASALIPKSFIGYLKNRRTQKRLLSETH